MTAGRFPGIVAISLQTSGGVFTKRTDGASGRHHRCSFLRVLVLVPRPHETLSGSRTPLRTKTTFTRRLPPTTLLGSHSGIHESALVRNAPRKDPIPRGRFSHPPFKVSQSAPTNHLSTPHTRHLPTIHTVPYHCQHRLHRTNTALLLPVSTTPHPPPIVSTPVHPVIPPHEDLLPGLRRVNFLTLSKPLTRTPTNHHLRLLSPPARLFHNPPGR